MVVFFSMSYEAELDFVENNRSVQRRTFLFVSPVGKILILFRNIDVPTSHSDCNGNICPTVVPWSDRIRICVHRRVRPSYLPSLLSPSLPSMSPTVANLEKAL